MHLRFQIFCYTAVGNKTVMLLLQFYAFLLNFVNVNETRFYCGTARRWNSIFFASQRFSDLDLNYRCNVCYRPSTFSLRHFFSDYHFLPIILGMSPSQNGQQTTATTMQHNGSRCSVSGGAQQQNQTPQQFGIGEPQR